MSLFPNRGNLDSRLVAKATAPCGCTSGTAVLYTLWNSVRTASNLTHLLEEDGLAWASGTDDSEWLAQGLQCSGSSLTHTASNCRLR